jgi:hypothetical protein
LTSFLDAIDDHLGAAADGIADIRASVVPLFEYDLGSIVIRMWRGRGRLVTGDGRVWLGTIDSKGVDHHQTPALRDGRDGSSSRLEFSLPFIDKATFNDIKAGRVPVANRPLTVYLVLVEEGEGLRPAGDLEVLAKLTLQSPTFSDSFGWIGGELRRQYKVTVVAKDGNAGRSRSAKGTYSDTSQQERAATLGVVPDYGCGFVALLADLNLQLP